MSDKMAEAGKVAITLAGHALMQTNPAVTLAVATVGVVRGSLAARYNSRLGEAAAALINEIAAAQNFGDPTTKHERVEQVLRDADNEAIDALEEGFRDMLGVLDPAAVPYVARLTAGYLVDKRARDLFFRRGGALLRDSSADNIRELRSLTAAVNAFAQEEAPNRGDAVLHSAQISVPTRLASGATNASIVLAFHPDPGGRARKIDTLSESTLRLLEATSWASSVVRSEGETRITFLLDEAEGFPRLLKLLA